MTQTEHLAAIRAKCLSFEAIAAPTMKALARITIAAIDTCQPITDENMPLVQSIIAAYPEELL